MPEIRNQVVGLIEFQISEKQSVVDALERILQRRSGTRSRRVDAADCHRLRRVQTMTVEADTNRLSDELRREFLNAARCLAWRA